MARFNAWFTAFALVECRAITAVDMEESIGHLRRQNRNDYFQISQIQT